MQGAIAALQSQGAQQQSAINALTGQVSTLKNDLRVVASAGFAGLEQQDVAANFVATLESQGGDPIVAVDQVGADSGIAIDPNTVSTVDFDQVVYARSWHQLQSSLSVANSALASAQAAKNNYNINDWEQRDRQPRRPARGAAGGRLLTTAAGVDSGGGVAITVIATSSRGLSHQPEARSAARGPGLSSIRGAARGGSKGGARSRR